MIKISLIICLIHFLYYIYVGIIYEFVKMGSIYNTPHKEIFRLRSEYNVMIKTFRKENFHWGFSWGKTIYLNERLLKVKNKNYKALNVIFHHEYYHMKHHFKKIVLMRLLFSLTPLLLIINWGLFTGVYVMFAYLMYYLTNNKTGLFEKQANEYALKTIK